MSILKLNFKLINWLLKALQIEKPKKLTIKNRIHTKRNEENRCIITTRNSNSQRNNHLDLRRVELKAKSNKSENNKNDLTNKAHDINPD